MTKENPIDELKDRLKTMFIGICEDESIYSKDEAMILFEEYEFDKDEIEIYPINMDIEENIDCDEEYDEPICYSDNILMDLDEYSDDQEFIITLPDEISNNVCAAKFREYILSNAFTNTDRIYIYDMFINNVFKYCEHSHIDEEIEYKKEVRKFINGCTINEFIDKYVTDLDFCRFVFNTYEVVTFNIEKNQNNSSENIISINDMIREKFSIIHNMNLSLGTTDSNSILIISKYLNGEIDSKSMNTIYKEQLGNLNIQDISNRDYMKIIMITDYLRMCELKYDSASQIDKVDKEYLDFIEKNSSKEILRKFKEDNDFAFIVISQFIELNLWCSNETKSSCKNVKQIKKINPLYTLDFMKKDN